MKMRIAGMVLICMAAAGVVRAEEWPQWRGPNMDGSSSAEGLPETFSKTENVKWAVDMPGPGASTPVVWGDQVFITAAVPDEGGDWEKGELVAWCLDRSSGETKWRHVVGKGIAKDDRSNFAAPSAVTDGEIVVFFFSSGQMVAYDMEGRKIWDADMQDRYGEFAFGWTFSTSPMLYRNKLYFQLLQRDVEVDGRGKPEGNESFIVALDPKSGEEIWKVNRPSKAVMESREAFSTPVIYEHGGVTELLVVGGDSLSGHEPETGVERWRWGTWNPGREPFWRLVPSPVGGDGVILACGPKKSPVYAVKTGIEGDHEDDESVLAWVSGDDKIVSTDVATPLFYKGHFYILNSNGPKKYLNCVEPKTGKVIYSEMIPSKGKIEASPTGADGKVYLMSMMGETFVVKAGPSFELLHSVEMGDGEDRYARSSISVSRGNLFIRTDSKLFCIGL